MSLFPTEDAMRRRCGGAWVSVFVVAACASWGCGARDPVISGAGGNDGGPAGNEGQASDLDLIDIYGLRSVITRSDGTEEDVGDQELFLSPGNSAAIYLTVGNYSNGWVLYTFEACLDNAQALELLDPFSAPEQPLPIADPCAVLDDNGAWTKLMSGYKHESIAAMVRAKDHPSGGYVTVTLRVELAPNERVVDIIEYTVPYRVLPSG